jgi:hypothetical protein
VLWEVARNHKSPVREFDGVALVGMLGLYRSARGSVGDVSSKSHIGELDTRQEIVRMIDIRTRSQLGLLL